MYFKAVNKNTSEKKNLTTKTLFRKILLAVNGFEMKYYFILSILNVIYTVHPSKKICTSWCGKVSYVIMYSYCIQGDILNVLFKFTNWLVYFENM